MAAPDEPEPRAEAFPALWPVPTRWADDDHYGHVDAVSYYSYFDTAINGWLMASTGLDVRRLPAIGIVTEASCRFVRELSFPDQLHVGLSVERIEVSDIVYALAVFREDAEGFLELSATGRFVHVYVDPDTRQPAPIPPEIRSAAMLLMFEVD
ncbi:acyl-CoA thioesterase [Prescottella equi]|uniref:Thioesterase family protein n=2 Tax=Rhodococcus hoagii TaxID=43767 RepID=E9SYQ3_RHOHA|nr:thioesterase family protein [Prescottella equi]EGD25274.1 thioesterase family protein [Prescottella equi ATCC 33707]ERN46389.1 thioesterase [Prescottella equi NBRC 101255 = C 7]MBM4626026.1 acyl-CoA thioesterase [Prescottella equi]ORL25540.1 4-hydroxybenzoyl-CoA thioesterase [Prescottella equi]ORL98663.1 4-hydroxybenzoyl-CoA thioesterase [Prescottella equi]